MKTRRAIEAALRIELDGVDPQLATEVLLDLAREQVSRLGGERPEGGAGEPLRARVIEVRGERLTMTEWSQRLGIPRRTLHDRVETEGPACIERMLGERES